MTGEQSALDTRTLDELRASVGGDQEFFVELIDEFLEDAPRQLESLRAATTSGDADAARRAAHTLKSTGRTFGADAFATLCQEVEAAAADGDLDAVPARLDAIAEAWELVRAALDAARSGTG